jgi:hypothetical protein
MQKTPMPKRITPLSETKIRTAKNKEKEYKIFDGGGLYLLVTPTGGKLWRLKYRFEGKEKLLGVGFIPGNQPCRCQAKKRGSPKATCQWS